MYYLNDIFLKYGDRVMFQDVSLMFGPNEKIGLVGRNGSGKTTLLKIINEDISPDSGQVTFPKSTRVGFLKQFLPEHREVTILDETCKAFDAYNQIVSEVKSLEESLGGLSEEQMVHTLESIDVLNQKLNALEIQNPEAEASKILKGLGFKEEQLSDALDTLSGGWMMRVELAKLLLSKPDILLLDEPTNHLDIEAILWFEQYVKNYQSCVIMISHDETFLSNTTNRIIEIELGRVEDYKYIYPKYLIEKKNRKEIKLAQYVNQQKVIKDRERTITRFKAKATKTKMAQSMEKQLEKMERVEIVQEDTSSLRLNFPYAGREGRVVYHCKALSKSYDELQVFSDAELSIERGDKVAFVGQNGQGKTTLSKIISGMVPHTTGESNIGHNVQTSIFLQDQADTLEPGTQIIDIAREHGPQYTEGEVRSILGAFMFSGEDVEKKVSVLSGGEKARVALACLIMKPSNLLILDEPTNHLDVVAKQVLKEAVEKYEGTLIVVSHDRTFLSGLTNKTFEFVNGKIVEHLGDIDYVLNKRKHDTLRDYAVETKGKDQPKNQKEKLSFEQRKKLNRELTYLERDMEKLESEVKALEEKMMDPEFFKSKEAIEATQQLNDKKASINQKMERWEEVATLLEN